MTLLTTLAAAATVHLGAGGPAQGIPVKVPGGELLIEPIDVRTMRVRFSRTGDFAEQRVPTLVPRGGPPAFWWHTFPTVSNVGTKAIQAVIDRKTGAIRFLTADGKLFLAEEPGSRQLTPEVLQGPNPAASYRAKLGFRLAPGEGVYGLGQHQDGFLDYRGSSVVLEQVNREIAIPFLVTSGGYGILWNNPSHTVVHVASKSSELPVMNEYDDSGRAGGFTAHYFNGEHFDNPVSTIRESRIDHDWDKTPPNGLEMDHYSVRWTGSIIAPTTGVYNFKTVSDDGVRLWIDDKRVIDNWTVHAPTLNMAKLALEAGSRHRFKLEYFQATGGAIMRLDCGIEQPTNSLVWDSESADDIDYCVFYGPSLDGVLKEYRHATGEAPMPPKTALGYWQSKERYTSQKDWIDIASEYRRRRHPIDNIVQDWFYWDPWPWGSHKFDPKRYPDPAAGIASLHDDFHMQFMISVWGKFAPGSDNYPNTNLDLMASKGYLYPGIGSSERYYDAFNPEARKLYWSLMRDQIFKDGVDAWWLDASEPEVDMHKFRSVKTASGLGAQVLNAWPLMHTIGVSQGQLEAAPDKRVFILTRSGYAGQQRTGAACWSGDITATWDVFSNQIPAGLNFCLSGVPYWTTDIGAFFSPGELYPKGASDPAYRELFTRWFQYGSFCPIFRVHGTNFAKEMWRFGPATEKILNKYDELRYRLMPYIYSQAWAVTSGGATMMRALVMDFPRDKAASEVKDEYLFGPSLLVCPVIKAGAVSRDVYLPRGTKWTDFWTGKSYEGGIHLAADAPIDKIPIFVRAGSIIPIGPLMQYVDEKATDPLEVRIYAGANGAFSLYEDDGKTNAYKKGAFSTIPLSWDDRRHVLTIGDRSGVFSGMLNSRTINVSVRGFARPYSTNVSYSGHRIYVRT